MFRAMLMPLECITSEVNSRLEEYTPVEIAIVTLASYLTINAAYRAYQCWDTKEIKKRLINTSVQTLMRLPVVGPMIKEKIDTEIISMVDGIRNDIDKKRARYIPVTTLPKQGLTKEEILKRFQTLQDDYHEGQISGAVYAKYDRELKVLLQTVWVKTALTNPMHSEWPLINLMEAEVISMCHDLLRSPLKKYLSELEYIRSKLKTLSEAEHNEYQYLHTRQIELERKVKNPGIMTHGGSTSIFEACKAHVFYAREQGKDPVIIIPATAHIAFKKAADILHAKLVEVEIDVNGRADLYAMERALRKHNGNVAMIVGSAPSFIYGVIDPIKELGLLAQKYQVPLHIDSCLGGFLTCFARDAGHILPPCDLSVPGAMSVSIDTHKYGKTPKGTSVLVFHPDCKASTTHVHLDWAGGMYVTEGLDGSRSGADIATTWTVLCSNGKDHYVRETKNILNLRVRIEELIRKIDGLIIPYDNNNAKLQVIGIRAKPGIDLLLVEKYLKDRHWSIQIMQTKNQQVDGLHFCLTSIHTKQNFFAETFFMILQDAFTYAKLAPVGETTGNIKVYGKFKKGVPEFVQREIGEGYVGSLNTIRG